MNKEVNIWLIIRKKLGIIILFGILFGALSFLFLVISEKSFKVSTKYLMVQEQAESQDYYNLSKSIELTGNILSESIYSEFFINEVVGTEKVNGNFLPADKKDKLEKWSNMVKVKKNTQLGMLEISILSDNQKEAYNVSDGISDVLINKNYLFRGDGKNINVKVLSGPIFEKNPDGLKILSVTSSGFAFGAFVVILFFYFQSEKERSLFSIQRDYQRNEYEEYQNSLSLLE